MNTKLVFFQILRIISYATPTTNALYLLYINISYMCRLSGLWNEHILRDITTFQQLYITMIYAGILFVY